MCLRQQAAECILRVMTKRMRSVYFHSAEAILELYACNHGRNVSMEQWKHLVISRVIAENNESTELCGLVSVGRSLCERDYDCSIFHPKQCLPVSAMAPTNS